MHWTICLTAFYTLRESLIHAPILAFPTETGQYILDTDASNFGLGGVLSQIQDDVERVVAYCSRALRPSQRRNAGCCGHVHPIPVVSAWRQIHSSHGSLVISVVTPIQGHGGYDGPVVACSTTISVLHHAPAGTMVMRTASREFPRRRADNVHDRTAHRSSRLLSPLISRPAAQRMLT